MSVSVKTQENKLHLRSLKTNGAVILTGRWYVVGASGILSAPGSGSKVGAVLCIQGNYTHVGTAAEFGLVGTGYASTNKVLLPGDNAAGQAAVVLPPILFDVGPEGFDPAVAFAVGDLLEVDNYGRLVVLAAGRVVGRVEAATASGGLTTSITVQAIA